MAMRLCRDECRALSGCSSSDKGRVRARGRDGDGNSLGGVCGDDRWVALSQGSSHAEHGGFGSGFSGFEARVFGQRGIQGQSWISVAQCVDVLGPSSARSLGRARTRRIGCSTCSWRVQSVVRGRETISLPSWTWRCSLLGPSCVVGRGLFLGCHCTDLGGWRGFRKQNYLEMNEWDTVALSI